MLQPATLEWDVGLEPIGMHPRMELGGQARQSKESPGLFFKNSPHVLTGDALVKQSLASINLQDFTYGRDRQSRGMDGLCHALFELNTFQIEPSKEEFNHLTIFPSVGSAVQPRAMGSSGRLVI